MASLTCERQASRIINLSSPIYGLVGVLDVPPYHAPPGRGALDEQKKRRTDALLYAPDRIRVNSVHC